MKIAICHLLVGVSIATCSAYTANDAGKTISSDGTVADTQAALNYVAAKNADGWVLTVGTPGATYTWGTSLSIHIPHVFTIQGASPSNRPTITVTTSSGNAIGITCADGKTTTFKDFIFNEWPDIGLIGIYGSGIDCFRLTNLKFNHTKGITTVNVGSLQPTSTGQGPYGLIDHCEITGAGSGYGFFIRENQQPETGFTPGSWMRPMTFGGKQAVYIEDCSFHSTSYTPGRPAIDGDNGGRVVFRRNVVVNQTVGTHGADSPGPVNSILQCEIMHNTFTFNDGYAVDNVFFLRGGTAVIFDNAVNRNGPTTTLNFLTKLTFFRALAGDPITRQDRFYPQDYMGTQQPGMGVIAGTGKDPNFPTKPWGSVPVYSWNNHNNVPTSYGEVGGGSNGFDAINRDYFIGTAKPGYAEFTYPHPLQANSNSPSLAAPSNLRITPGP